jgi:HPt (histidine-containing phosphotransfer) domain-containing protein
MSPTEPTPTRNLAEAPELSAAIDRLWTRFLPEIRERVAVLEAAAAAFAANTLTLQQHEEANTAAHKLAGVLGTFDLTRGTILARELELLYAHDNGPNPDFAARLASIAAEIRTLVENRK